MEPIIVYHSTCTGEGDKNLLSFQRNGVLVPRGIHEGSKQKTGFFVEAQELTAMYAADPEPGRRMIVAVKCDFGPGWELDYEAPDVAKQLLRKYAKQLAAVPPDALTVYTADSTPMMIQHVTPVNVASRKGLEIELLNPATHNKGNVFLSWKDHGANNMVGDSSLLQSLRDYLVSTIGDPYLKVEREHMRKAVLEPKHGYFQDIQMKYTGNTPPQIVDIQTEKAPGRWVHEPITAHRGSPAATPERF